MMAVVNAAPPNRPLEPGDTMITRSVRRWPYESLSLLPWLASAVLAGLLSALAQGCSGSAAPPHPARYVPRTRYVTVTTVPLLVKESASTYPFLRRDFAEGGVLEGKEVYAFSPSTITAVEGDTLRLTLINPEDDLHSFVLPDLAVPLPGQTITHVTYVARHAGILPIVCNVPGHLPMMSGQLVVLSGAAVAEGDGRTPARAGPR